MAGEIHSIYAVGIGSSVIGGISDQSLESGLADGGKPANGQVYRYFASVRSGKPRVSFSTFHIVDALTVVPAAGINLASSNLKFYGQEKVLAGARSPSAFISFLMANGLLYPTKVSCRTGDDAKLDCEGLLLTDPTGVNDFVSVGTSAPAALVAANDNLRYTLGAITIGGISIVNVTNVDIDFGVTATPTDVDSNIIPRFASIETIMPKITVDVEDISLITESTKFKWASGAGYGMHAKKVERSTSTIQFRKRELGGGFATSGHIVFTIQGLAYVSTIAKGTDQGDQSGQVVVELSKVDGTNAPITWS